MSASVARQISGEHLRRLADARTLERGVAYAKEGRVEVFEQSRTEIRAFVRGSERYLVELFPVGDAFSGRCSCPASQGLDFCKHCVAVAVALGAELEHEEPQPDSTADAQTTGRKPARAHPDDRFATDAELRDFIDAHGLAHAHKLGAEVLLELLPERERAALRYVLTRQGLTDFSSEQAVRRYGYALSHAPRLRELIPAAAFDFLHRERDALARARADEERTRPPESEETRALFEAALRFRRAHPPELPPRAREDLVADRLRFTDLLPGFLFTDDRPWRETYRTPDRPAVQLMLTPELTSGTCSLCRSPCVHTLAATDAVLLWLKELLTDDRRAMLEELRRPSWERALRAIEHATERRSEKPEWLSWRIQVHGDEGVTVEAWLHRMTKRGTPNAGTRISTSRLRELPEATRSPEDERVISLIDRSFGYAEHVLLKALVGHPRVFLAENPSAAVSVEAAKIGLLADHRGDSVALVPALDGAHLPAHLLATRRRRGREAALFVFDERARRLTVLDFPEEVERTLEAVERYGNHFPPESHAALVEKLSTLSARVPVAMPRTVMGEAVPAESRPVLRLELQPDRSVRAELRIRPLPESASFTPGDGARDVHVRREGKPLHARRDFAAELARAQAIWNRLALTSPRSASSGDGALAPLGLSVREDAAALRAPHRRGSTSSRRGSAPSAPPASAALAQGIETIAAEPAAEPLTDVPPETTLDRAALALPGEAPFTATFPDPQRTLVLLEELRSWGEEKPELEWRGSELRMIGRAQATALKVTLERKRDWFGVNGGLSMEGERVTLAVLLDAARRKERFVQLEGDRYLEISEALRRQLERLSDHTYRSAHGFEVGPSAVEALQALGEEGAEVDTDRAWQDLTQRIFAAKELRPRVPASLKATLRDYQLEGFQWLTRLASWGAGAVLADDMGLGKTVQALAVLLDRARLGPALVVAPTSVGFNWVDEARRFAPSLRFHLFAESEDRGARLEALKPRDVLVISYGLLARDERVSQQRFATIVFDEAQAMKNAGTQRAKAARALSGDFKFALSGTPLENHLGELWSLFRIVFPGLLGSWDAFRDRFATPIEKRIDPTAAPALSRVLQPFLLRRTKGQVAKELPARTDLRVPVVLSPEEWQLYEDARLAALSELETPKAKLRDQQRRVQVLAALTRLRLLASHPRLYDARSKVRSSKLARLLELIDELREEGHRALVFSQFTSHLSLVREALDARRIRYAYLDGSTPPKEREAQVRAFQEGDAPLFLISLKAGGFGLNLTGADNVIHLDPWWNPAVEDQASDRAHRIGQHRPVTVYRLVSKGTIEEQILALHEEKRELVLGVLEGKDQAARLSTKELLALLATPAARALDDEPASTRH